MSTTLSNSDRIESLATRCADLGHRQCFILQRILGGLSVKTDGRESVNSEELIEYIEGVVAKQEKRAGIKRS